MTHTPYSRGCTSGTGFTHWVMHSPWAITNLRAFVPCGYMPPFGGLCHLYLRG